MKRRSSLKTTTTQCTSLYNGYVQVMVSDSGQSRVNRGGQAHQLLDHFLCASLYRFLVKLAEKFSTSFTSNRYNEATDCIVGLYCRT
uniref:Uncharacterized protein n=1 Tax=Physcomitrium patens TaxID=3218 RepID=A0A2K1IX25_PHYPA|nr:hypothetical protein PHYPA_023645 [Physcomitrium patens]